MNHYSEGTLEDTKLECYSCHGFKTSPKYLVSMVPILCVCSWWLLSEGFVKG